MARIDAQVTRYQADTPPQQQQFINKLIQHVTIPWKVSAAEYK